MADASVDVQRVISAYDKAAPNLIPLYDGLDPARVLAPVLNDLPVSGQTVLDVGAGSGATAAWLTSKGCLVTAIEPAAAFRNHAQRRYPLHGISWQDDQLPNLSALRSDGTVYDAILVIGVLHHLCPVDQAHAVGTLSTLLASGGRMILSLRHGPSPTDRPGFPISTNDLTRHAQQAGLHVLRKIKTGSIQDHNRRAGVTWTWLVLGAPN